MELLIIFFTLFFTITSSSLKCLTKMVTSYGFNGILEAKKENMLFCPEVEFKCCSLLDELKYHKFWTTYYSKKHEKSFDLMESVFKDLYKKIKFFLQIDIEEIKKFLEDEENNLVIYEEIKNFDITSFDKIKLEIKNVQENDLENKKKFICFLCDLKNHLEVSEIDKKVYFQETICETLISGYKNFIKTKLLIIDSTVVKIHKLLNDLKIENESFAFDQEILDKSEISVLDGDKCLKGSFNIENCKNLCGKYSMANISRGFIGNLELYRGVMKRIDFLNNFIENEKENEEIAKENKKEDEIKKGEIVKEGEEGVEGEAKEEVEGEEKEEEEEEEGEKKVEGEEKQEEKKKSKKNKKKKKLKNRRLLSTTSKFFHKFSKIEKRLKKYRRLVKKMKRTRNVNRSKMNRMFYYNRYLNELPQNPAVQQIPINPNAILPQNPVLPQNPILPQNPVLPQNPALLQNPALPQNPALSQNPALPQNPELTPLTEPIKTPEEIAKEEEAKKKELKENYKTDLKLNITKKVYLEFYEKFKKGKESDFENLEWITNEFFEGDFLSNYQMGFHKYGSSFNYTISEKFNYDLGKLMDEVIVIMKEPKSSYEILPSGGTTYDVIEFLNQFLTEDIVDFNNDMEMVLGGITEGDEIDYEEILEKINQERIEIKKLEKEKEKKDKEEEEKKEKEKEKKKKEGGEGEEGGEEEAGEEEGAEGEGEEDTEVVDAETAEALLKKVKKLKKKLKKMKQLKI